MLVEMEIVRESLRYSVVCVLMVSARHSSKGGVTASYLVISYHIILIQCGAFQCYVGVGTVDLITMTC
jgi:hypothetical protein